MGLRRWIARHSAPVGAEFEAEGLLHAETARGSVTYRNYHRPGKRTSLEKRAMGWLIALTRSRLVIRSGRNTYVDVPWRDPRITRLDCSLDGPDRLLIRFDAAVFRPDSGGTVEIRVRCADPAALLALLDGCRA
jgi:hypothetical protein